MATTQARYTGDGATVLFSFHFPYIDDKDVKVTIDGVATTAFTIENTNVIRFDAAPASGTNIFIFRETGTEDIAYVFYPGSSIKAKDLNQDFSQILYVAQELQDTYFNPEEGGTINGDVIFNGDVIINKEPEGETDAVNKLYVDTQDQAVKDWATDEFVNASGDQMTGQLDMTNHKIVRLANPSEASDAVNKQYVDGILVGSGGNISSLPVVRYILTAVGGETVINPEAPIAPGNEIVTVNGSTLTPSDDYTINGTDSITLRQPLLADDQVMILSYNSLKVVEVGANFDTFPYTRWVDEADAGQTVFTGYGIGTLTLAYSPGFESVFLNGALLTRDVDYVANDKVSITLSQPTQAGDVVDIHSCNYIQTGFPTGLPATNISYTYPDSCGGAQSNVQEGLDHALEYTYPGGVPQCLNERLEQRVSVKDFGAKGDGVTDDSAAIQAAVDNLGNIPGGGTIWFPNGSYVVRTQIYTELFSDISKYRRWGISFKGESRLETKILVQNHDGFFEWNCAWTWRKPNRGGAANVNFSAKDFTVVLQADVLGDKLADGETDYSCGQIFRLLQGGGTNSHWQGVVFDNVDIQSYDTWETNPKQRYIPSLGTPPFNGTARIGNYARQGLFMRGCIRPTLINCNWSSSPYGKDVGQDQSFRTDAFEGESLDCSIDKSTNIITTTKPHNFSIGEPVIFEGNGDQVQYEVLWPATAQNIKSVKSLSDNKLCYFVSPINFSPTTFSLSPDYSCLTAEQANQIPSWEYPDDNPNYCPAVDLVRIPFEGTGSVSCKVFPATSNVFNYNGYGIALHGSAFWGLRFGYREENPFGEGSEGGIVRDSNFTADTGCFIQSVGVEPGFTIRNTHFNCRTGGLHVIGRKLMDVRDNIWYNQMYPPDMNSKSPVDGTTDFPPTAYSDIKLEKVWDSNFGNITFWWGDRTNRINVDADDECYGIVVKECKAACKDGILFKAASGSTDMKGFNNIAVSGTTYPVGRIYDGDIAVSHTTNAGGLLEKATPQVISGATEQEVTWDSTFTYDNFGATIDGSSIVIPKNQGINYVRFSASVLTTNNAEVVRIFVKRVGQNPIPGLSGQEGIGGPASNHVASYSSGIVQVKPGEKYSLYVTHMGGTDISILQNPATYFAYEVVNG